MFPVFRLLIPPQHDWPKDTVYNDIHIDSYIIIANVIMHKIKKKIKALSTTEGVRGHVSESYQLGVTTRSGLGSFTAIIPWQPVDNCYNICPAWTALCFAIGCMQQNLIGRFWSSLLSNHLRCLALVANQFLLMYMSAGSHSYLYSVCIEGIAKSVPLFNVWVDRLLTITRNIYSAIHYDMYIWMSSPASIMLTAIYTTRIKAQRRTRQATSTQRDVRSGTALKHMKRNWLSS